MNIQTKLLREDEVDYLEFKFSDDNIKKININDASDNSSLKSVFNDIIKLAVDSDVSLTPLQIDPSIGGGLLADVFSEYVTNLNQEMGKIRAELRVDEDE